MTVLPSVIQGGMGVGVSGWRLAHAVSSHGQLGVVSGTALDAVLARRLQRGDVGGHVRRALEHLPIPGVAERILDRYFIEGGKPEDRRFRSKPLPSIDPDDGSEELVVAANFVEVFLAKLNHANPVGVNYLEKIQIQTLPSLYGALLAGVDFVLMGAGIPRAIPGILDKLSAGLKARLPLDVKGADRGDDTSLQFDPTSLFPDPPGLKRPAFLAIVASHVLATMLSRSDVPPDGFVVEGPTAGGHNAPPRGKSELDDDGQPRYGPRDQVDLEVIRELGAPFWLAGSQATREGLAGAREVGAEGVQVGTAFAFCEESDLREDLKAAVLDQSRRGEVRVFTDPAASPTGFPFKIVELDGTLSDPDVYEDRTRVCDLGYLRSAHKAEDGSIEWRCPSEPVARFVSKGGDHLETEHRQCLCNALLANIDLGQRSRGIPEAPMVTAGDDAATVARFLRPGQTTYTAADVIDQLLT